jgi:arginyl-tRNA synthetase
MATTATPNALPPLPAVASTDPTKSPLDIFRIAIAQSISSAIPTLPLEKALEGVDFGKKEADFTVALPRFKLGGKPDEWGKKLADEVCS